MKKIILGLLLGFSGIIFAQEIVVKSVTASSCLNESGNIYSADYLFDNSEKSWVEGEKGSGIGVTINIEFKDEIKLEEFAIKNGFGDNSLYFENNRVRKLKAEFSGGRSAIIILEDNPGFQKVVLSNYTYTRFIKLTIEDVYRGTKYDDTAISEISFKPWTEIKHQEMNSSIMVAHSDDFYNSFKEFTSKKGNSIFDIQRYDNRHGEDIFLVSTRFTNIPVEDGSMYYRAEILSENMGFQTGKKTDYDYYVLFFKWNGTGFEKAQYAIPYSEKTLETVLKSLDGIQTKTKESKALSSMIKDILKAKKDNCPYVNRVADIDLYDDDLSLSLEFKDWKFKDALTNEELDAISLLSQSYVLHSPCQRLTKLILAPREEK
ncbi:MAG: hypothetical protein KBS84_02075 [Treponema sp.]|nr:hypothetical protein [Candidatus Treponema scatequi]